MTHQLHTEPFSEDEIENIVSQLLSFSGTNKVIAFYGELGAGKTTLIKALCKQLGVESGMSSPSFALINEYKRNNDEPVYHFDFYRIKTEDEVYDMGYEEYFYSGKYCFIEWPEKISKLLPDFCVKVEITAVDSKRILKAEIII